MTDHKYFKKVNKIKLATYTKNLLLREINRSYKEIKKLQDKSPDVVHKEIESPYGIEALRWCLDEKEKHPRMLDALDWCVRNNKLNLFKPSCIEIKKAIANGN